MASTIFGPIGGLALNLCLNSRKLNWEKLIKYKCLPNISNIELLVKTNLSQVARGLLSARQVWNTSEMFGINSYISTQQQGLGKQAGMGQHSSNYKCLPPTHCNKGDVENPIHNTLSKPTSAICSAYERPTGVCLLP